MHCPSFYVPFSLVQALDRVTAQEVNTPEAIYLVWSAVHMARSLHLSLPVG